MHYKNTTCPHCGKDACGTPTTPQRVPGGDAEAGGSMTYHNTCRLCGGEIRVACRRNGDDVDHFYAILPPLLQFAHGDFSVTLEERDTPTPGGGTERDLHLQVMGRPGIADRPHVAGWIFGLEQRKLAERLLRAIRAGVAFTGYRIQEDIDGDTYISVEKAGFFHKRHMGPELKKLGY